MEYATVVFSKRDYEITGKFATRKEAEAAADRYNEALPYALKLGFRAVVKELK